MVINQIKSFLAENDLTDSKRVNFSARTVITSDPNIGLNYLGVPIKIAMNVTFPEYVTAYNIDKLTKIVRNGRDAYPGANYVIPQNNLEFGRQSKIDLRYRKKSVKLHIGDIVERHLLNDDPVIFNRQPTLHKMSMMGHKVTVINDENLCTFRLNVTVTTPYNADFDGDEMNMFVPQTIQSQVEIENILNVKQQIISPGSSKPIIKFKQDTIIGAYFMTRMNKEIDYHDAMNIAAYCEGTDILKLSKKNIDLKALFSLVIPKEINYRDKNVTIMNGKINNGNVDEKILNQAIAYYAWDRHGSDVTKTYYDNAQRVVTRWLLDNGFSIGLGDATTDKQIIDEVKLACMLKNKEVDKLITQMENNPDALDSDIFETDIRDLLTNTSVDIIEGKIFNYMKEHHPDNNFFIAINSGSKGSKNNIGQIIGGLGQNVQEFNRIKKKVNNRTLPHIFQNDDRGASRGYIMNSFYHGLDPIEFFFHHMSARDGMIDTAIKSVTGDTPIIIIENDICKHINIGEWIDNEMSINKDKVKYSDIESLDLNHEVLIPTTDLNCNVSWAKITNVTRHNPGNRLYKIYTKSGRTVIVTESHSLLIWNEQTQELERVKASLVTTNNYVPVTYNLQKINFTNKSKNAYKLNSFYNKIEFDSVKDRDIANMYSTFTGSTYDIDGNSLKYNSSNSSNIYHDIMLDKIDRIEIIDGKLYSKTYDVTVPSTLNFCIANGLHIVDTSESGYLQRKLIKGLEDIMVAYDKTVRSSNNVLIQMIYGTNGINQIHHKITPLKVILMNNEEIKNIFGFTKQEIDNILNEFTDIDKKKFIKWNNDYCNMMQHMRDELREIQMKIRVDYKTIEENYSLPVNFVRLIEDTKNIITSSKVDRVNPFYIMAAIEYILKYDVTNIVLCNNQQTMKLKDQERAKFIFKLALLEYLAPRKCIFEYKLNIEQFNQLVVEIIRSFKKSCVEPGEMAGIVSAQSLGEVLTQMSVRGGLKILIMSKKNGNKQIIKTTIGEFIESKYKEIPDKIINIKQHKGSTELEISDKDAEYYICGVNQNETVMWNKISHCSRHPTNGNLLKITTQTKRSIITTKSHNFLKRTENGIVAIDADHLEKGMRIPVARKVQFIPNNLVKVFNDIEFELTHEFGWMIGAYLADGSIKGNVIKITKIAQEYYDNVYKYGSILGINVNQSTRQCEYGPSTDTYMSHKPLAQLLTETCGKGSFNKHVPDFIHDTNINCVRGLVRGFMDGDGNIAADRHIIRAGSRSKELIEDMTMLLTYFGILASNYEEVKSNNKTPLYCLGIPHKYARQYLEQIGTDIESKRADIEKIIAFSEGPHKNNIENIDAIPELGTIIAKLGTQLAMPGNSRTYGYIKRNKLTIGRRTLIKYIKAFEEQAIKKNLVKETKVDIDYLKQIANGDVIWDEIETIEEIEDPKEYVYDFTVPGNQTFMIYNGIVVHNTLNSVAWNEKLLVESNNNSKCVNIGEFIDQLMEENEQRIEQPNKVLESEYLDISKYGYNVPTVDENGKMHWKLITAITRHLPGDKVIKVKTLSGREVIATKSKSFLIRKDNKITEIEGSKLKIGDRLPVQKDSPIHKYIDKIDLCGQIIKLDTKLGFAFGTYLSNGNVINNIVIQFDTNRLPDWAYLANDEFVKNLVQGYFNGKTSMTSSSKELLLGISNLLTRFGTKSNLIGENKLEIDKEVINNDENIYDDPIIEIIEDDLINFTPDNNKVYDLTVEDTKNFTLLNGLCMRDTFHKAGTGVGGMQGIPRIREIISYSKNIQTPIMSIKLNKNIRNDTIMVHRLEAYLKYTTFGNLIDHMDIIYDPKADKIMSTDKIDKQNVFFMTGNSTNFENLPWLYKFTISREAMIEYDITLLDIKARFVAYWESYSSESTLIKKKMAISKVASGCILSNYDNSVEPIIHIRFDINNVDNFILIDIGQHLLHNVSMKGIKLIEKTKNDKQSVIDYLEDGTIKKDSSEYIISTAGIDLNKIKTIKYIDFDNTLINDIHTAFINFGIEATRVLIINEIYKAYTSKNINMAHVELLSDVMTNTGSITSIDRHGLLRLDTDPLSRASFENTIEQLLNAAAFNEVDHMKSVSSRIMAGRCIKGGTGLCDIELDTELFENSEYTKQASRESKLIRIQENKLINDIMDKDNIIIFMPQ